MESLHIDDRVMVRAELVRRKQDREALREQEAAVDRETAHAIRKASGLGVSMEEAADLAGVSRTTGYRLLERLEKEEAAQAGDMSTSDGLRG